MSIYNLIHGTNPLAPALLFMLDLDPNTVPRFRDCYLARDAAGTLEIHVLTRTGGGNRADHESENKKLAANPNYIGDDDAPHDSTYAIFRFRIPAEMAEEVASFVAEEPRAVPKSPAERFEEFMSAMRDNPDDPDVKRVAAVIQPILEEVASADPDKQIFTL